MKKAQTIPKLRKLHKNGKIFTKIWAKRLYDSPPHLNLTLSSLGAEEPQPRIKMQNKENKTRHKYGQTNTQVQNTISPYQLKKTHTYIHKQHPQQQIFTKPRSPPITKHNYAQETYKGDHSRFGSTNPKFHLKINHPHNHSPELVLRY